MRTRGGDGRRRRGARHRPMRPGAALTCLLAVALAALAGCGVTDTGPVEAGAPARGQRAADGGDVLRAYFLTSHGVWPVLRPAGAGAGPQAALDALLAGPTRSERARGLATALPDGKHRVRAEASDKAVDLDLPWLVSDLDREAVNQLVCTAAAAPGVPGAQGPADVVVRVHEPGMSSDAWPVRCDENSAAAPAESDGPTP